jgi:hypothetical protein
MVMVQRLGEGGWTATMSDAVARRIAETIGEAPEFGEGFLQDGMDVMGMDRDEYARWFHRQMSTPGGETEFEAHLQAVLVYAAQRVAAEAD